MLLATIDISLQSYTSRRCQSCAGLFCACQEAAATDALQAYSPGVQMVLVHKCGFLATYACLSDVNWQPTLW